MENTGFQQDNGLGGDPGSKPPLPSHTMSIEPPGYDYITTPGSTAGTQSRPVSGFNVYDQLQPQKRCSRLVVCLSVWLGVLAVAVIVLLCFFLIYTPHSEMNENTTGTEVVQSGSTTVPTTPQPSGTTVPTTPPEPHNEMQCDTQCDLSMGCTKPRDTTACTRCRQAQVMAGYRILCLESCEALDFLPKYPSNNVTCQDLKLVNIALDDFSTTCEASSVYEDSDYWACVNVMDGGEMQWAPAADGAGPWIQFDFTQEYIVTGIEITGRTSYDSQCSQYDIFFSDYTIHKIEWECVDRRNLVDYFFAPVKTTSVRIMCKVDCRVGGAQGFRGIRIWTLMK